MTAAAVSDNPNFEISDVEMRREGLRIQLILFNILRSFMDQMLNFTLSLVLIQFVHYQRGSLLRNY